ncbi:MAG: hypothetical protein C4576_27650 [Desulfobacteraceae bacterium]|nr:MAG: hypothetical protein C4576_27650 [Desulfobacteraceae bacterium]
MVFWWVGRIALTLCGCFFVLFGIHILITSFYLSDPALFIMSFIASTLIILFSAAIVAGLVAQMIRAFRSSENSRSEEKHEDH